MPTSHIVSPRTIRHAMRLTREQGATGGLRILWGPDPSFGAYLLHHREAANLSLRAAAARLEVSHTHLAQMEQYETKGAPSLELLVKIGIVYRINEGELLHKAGYRWEVSDEVLEDLTRADQRDLKAILLSEEFRPFGLSEDDLDMFPASVANHIVNLVRMVDLSARKGGPTVSAVLARGRRTT